MRAFVALDTQERIHALWVRPNPAHRYAWVRDRSREVASGAGGCRSLPSNRASPVRRVRVAHAEVWARVSHVMVSVAHARCRDFKMQNVTSWVAPRGALPISRSGVVQDCAVGVMQDVARGLAAATSHALSAPCVLDSSACVYDLPSTISWC
jgi:hypothetical protein